MLITRGVPENRQRTEIAHARRTAESAVNLRESGLRDVFRKAERISATALLAGTAIAHMPATAGAESKGKLSAAVVKNTCVVSSVGSAGVEAITRFENKPWTIVTDIGGLTKSVEDAYVYNGTSYAWYSDTAGSALHKIVDISVSSNARPFIINFGNNSTSSGIPTASPIYYIGIFDTALTEQQIAAYSNENAVGMLTSNPKDLVGRWPTQQSTHTLKECNNSLVFVVNELGPLYFGISTWATSSSVSKPGKLNFSVVSLPSSSGAGSGSSSTQLAMPSSTNGHGSYVGSPKTVTAQNVGKITTGTNNNTAYNAAPIGSLAQEMDKGWWVVVTPHNQVVYSRTDPFITQNIWAVIYSFLKNLSRSDTMQSTVENADSAIGLNMSAGKFLQSPPSKWKFLETSEKYALNYYDQQVMACIESKPIDYEIGIWKANFGVNYYNNDATINVGPAVAMINTKNLSKSQVYISQSGLGASAAFSVPCLFDLNGNIGIFNGQVGANSTSESSSGSLVQGSVTAIMPNLKNFSLNNPSSSNNYTFFGVEGIVTQTTMKNGNESISMAVGKWRTSTNGNTDQSGTSGSANYKTTVSAILKQLQNLFTPKIPGKPLGEA